MITVFFFVFSSRRKRTRRLSERTRFYFLKHEIHTSALHSSETNEIQIIRTMIFILNEPWRTRPFTLTVTTHNRVGLSDNGKDVNFSDSFRFSAPLTFTTKKKLS